MSIGSVFGQNLRSLCATKPSISAVCRDLDINRVQFNRYLAGTSYPKPDILEQICQYFGVDARIYVETLKSEHFIKNRSLSSEGSGNQFVETLQTLHRYFGTYDFRLSEDFLKDGFYVAWRKSFSYPDLFTAMLLKVERENNLVFAKFYDRKHRDIGSSVDLGVSLKVTGVIFGHPAGALMLDWPIKQGIKSTGLDLLCPYDFTIGAYPSLSMTLKPEVPGQSRVAKMLLQPIRNETSSVLHAARRGRFLISADKVPAPFLRYISSTDL